MSSLKGGTWADKNVRGGYLRSATLVSKMRKRCSSQRSVRLFSTA